MPARQPYGAYRPGWSTRVLLALSQNTPLGRGKARRLMAGLVRGLNADVLDTELFGLNARLHLHNNSSEVKALMNPGRYSHAEFAFAAEHMPPIEGVFVDIGANAGLFSLGVASLLATGTMLAFEPQPDLFRRLKRNLVELNTELSTRVDIRLFDVAIGAESGHLQLCVPRQLGQTSARLKTSGDVVDVPVQTLLEALNAEHISQVDLLKVDVEGFEDNVLLPFFETAPRALWPRALIVEHCHRDRWQRDCEAYLVGQGYTLARKDRTNLMLSLAGGGHV